MMSRLSAALAACALMLAATAGAQTPAPTDSSAQASPAPSATPVPATTPSAVLGEQSPVPSRPHFVTARDEATIRSERDAMNALAAQTDRDVLDLKKKLVQARAIVDVKKREIDTLSSKIKAAKQAKDDATRQSLEGERKRQDNMRTFFDRLADVADAQESEAEARLDWAKARVQQCDLELQLVGRAGVTSYDADPTVFRTEQEYLAAVKTRAQAEGKLNDRIQNTVDKELKAYSQWADYLAGK